MIPDLYSTVYCDRGGGGGGFGPPLVIFSPPFEFSKINGFS